jgi:hypothetical protein
LISSSNEIECSLNQLRFGQSHFDSLNEHSLQTTQPQKNYYLAICLFCPLLEIARVSILLVQTLPDLLRNSVLLAVFENQKRGGRI